MSYDGHRGRATMGIVDFKEFLEGAFWFWFWLYYSVFEYILLMQRYKILEEKSRDLGNNFSYSERFKPVLLKGYLTIKKASFIIL